MSIVQLPGSIRFDSQIKIHTGTQKYDVSLDKEFQEYLTKKHHKDDVINQGKYKNYSCKGNGQIESIMFRIMLTLNTNI